MAARRNTTNASLISEATYTLLLSGLTATELAPIRPSVPVQLGGPVPVLPIHPAGVRSPLAARRNTTTASLISEATYTLLLSGLTATELAPIRPSVPVQLGGRRFRCCRYTRPGSGVPRWPHGETPPPHY